LLGSDTEYLENTFIKTNSGKEISLAKIKEMMIKLDVIDGLRFENESASLTGKAIDESGKATSDLLNKSKGFDINRLNPLSPIIDANMPITRNADGSIEKIDVMNPLKSLFKSSQDMGTKQFIAYDIGRNIGSTVEGHSKATNFLANIIQDKDFFEAADNTKKFLFDYNDLSDFERKVMKRIIPFYTWMRKNIPLQLEMFFTKPGVYSGYNKMKNEIEKNVPEDQRVEDKYKNTFAQDWIQIPGTMKGKESRVYNPKTKQYEIAESKNEPSFWNPNLPLADLGKIPMPTADFAKQMFSSLNPAIKVPIELQANKNVYFDTPISGGVGDTKDAPGYIQRLMGGTVDKPIQMDAKDRYVLQNLSGFMENISKVTDLKNSNDETGLALLKILLGPSTNSYDVETYKKWSQRDRLKMLKDLAKKVEEEK
jgi:hypothetical protein